MAIKTQSTRSRDRKPTRKVPERPHQGAAQRIAGELATRIGPHKYDMWFGHTQLDVEGKHVSVTTDSPFVARWIDSHFSTQLRGVVDEAIGTDAEIDVRVVVPADDDLGDSGIPPLHDRPGDFPPHRETAPSSRPGKGRGRGRGDSPQSSDDQPRRRGPSFRRLEEFIVGRSNRLAYSAACQLIDGADSSSVSPLFIHGECGLGKTHLLQGICRRFARHTGRPDGVRYVTGEQFTNEFIAAVRGNAIETFRKRVRKLDLLAIDDVHFLSNKVRTQSEFLHTLDAIDLTGSRVVLASDEHPRHIKKFSQALVSRFMSGMVVEVARPDRDTRIAIIERLASARNLPISSAAFEAIASRCVGSVRELEGTVTKLAALRSLTNESLGNGDDAPGKSDLSGMSGKPGSGSPCGQVGLVLVEQLFKDHGWQPPTPVRIGTVVDVTCERLGVTRADLMGSGRNRRVVLARALVAFLGREMTTMSYPELARALGRSYHSTIHTAEQRLRRQMLAGQSVDVGDAQKPMVLREFVDQLRHEITRATARP